MRTGSIAIFGCTADPFTVAHRAIVEEIINQNVADQVVIVPTMVNWHRKDKQRWLSDDERVKVIEEMMKCSTVGYNRWTIDAGEIHTYYTFDDDASRAAWLRRRRFIDKLITMKNCYRDYNLKVVIGHDEFSIFKQWAEWESILELAQLVVVERNIPVSPPESDIPHETMFLPEQYNDVSATAIREKFMNSSDPKLAVTNYLVETCPRNIPLLQTPIFNVIEKRLKDTNFRPIQVIAPDWVSILVKNGNEFTVVKQVRYGLGRPFMEFPCGMVEPGEFAAHAACRELEEETGIKLINAQNDFVYLGKIPTNPAFMTNYMHYFFVDLDDAKFERVNQRLDEHEKIIVSEDDINDLYQRAFNTDHELGEETPALMCTALFLYDNYRKYPSRYKKGVPFEN